MAYLPDGALIYKGNPDPFLGNFKHLTTSGFDYAMFNNSLTGSLEYFGRQVR